MKNLSIIKILKKLRKNKYQNTLISLNEAKKIKIIKKKIFLLFKKNKKNDILYNVKIDNDFTYNSLKKIYFKKKLNSVDKKFIEKIYHKYNYNLKLRTKYNKNFKSISNHETNIKSYIYLGLIIKPNKKINFLQILNMILKISDQIIINLKKIKSYHEKKVVSDLLFKEKLYLSKIRDINGKI